MAKKTISINLDGSANALALNKDANLVAVAGRTVFKIYEIGDDKFTENLNLRVGKNLNLNYSCNDVAWNYMDENVLATAATNGVVVTWNLQKQSRSKLDVIFSDHKRTVNKVCFHPSEPHFLLSGSQDGTMKLFDLRRKEASSEFISNSESVRDVQFAPGTFSYFNFAAVQENGAVEIWDIRRNDRPDSTFIAHSGPVFACDWHPGGKKKKWIATAGRDKTIKVWDLSSGANKPQLLYCVQTIASVSRIKWRPSRDSHIGSSSLVVDFGIYVWDINRPYVPSAIFLEHKDVATGFAWKNDPRVFLSTSKDGTLIQHTFSDAFRPSDHYNPLGLTINPTGNIAFASSDNILKNNSNANTVSKELVKAHSVGPNSMISSSGIISLVTPTTSLSNYSNVRISNIFKKAPDLTEQFRNADSSLILFELNNSSEKILSMDWFVESAKQYQLTGKPINELCEHNSLVAANLDRLQVSQTWKLLSQLYSTVRSSTLSGGNTVSSSIVINETNDRSENTNPSRHASGSTGRHLSGNKTKDFNQTQTKDFNHHSNDEDSEFSVIGESSFFNQKMMQTENDFLLIFNDPFPTNDLTNNDIFSNDNYMNQDWELPREAFITRHSLAECALPTDVTDYGNEPSSPNSLDDEDDNDDDGNNHVTFFNSNTELTNSTFIASKISQNPPWIHSDLIAEILHFYANQGDVQMSVAILLVLNDKVKSIVDVSYQEQWFLSYIDLLSKFQLWNILAQVISLCPLQSINELSHTSTTIYSNCGLCNKSLNSKVGWVCQKCKTEPSNCSVCHIAVSGLYVWCQGCSHGGHLNHIKEWFSKNILCPSGCGHQCEYT